MVTVDHYTLVREPGGEYESHVTPNSGKGVDIGAEIVTLVSQLIDYITVITML